MHLVNGTGNSPAGTADPGVVEQDKSSRGSVDTTKTRSDPQRVRMSSGERPIGAAKDKQPNTKALCQPPLPKKKILLPLAPPSPHQITSVQPFRWSSREPQQSAMIRVVAPCARDKL